MFPKSIFSILGLYLAFVTNEDKLTEWPHGKPSLARNQALVSVGKLRTCSKITRPHLGLMRDGGGFLWSLDFFASFLGQAKNDDQFYYKL